MKTLLVARRWSLVALAAAAGACSGGKWREADARLNAAAEPYRREGFAPLSGPYNTFGDFTGEFGQAWRLPLDSGVAYVIGVDCTAGCTRAQAHIEGQDAASWLRVAAPRTDTFTVHLSGSCASDARCWWVAQVYAKGIAGLRPGFAGGER